jgi:hypothetical protein
MIAAMVAPSGRGDRGIIMDVVPDEDITMFARGLLGRQGSRALGYAKNHAQHLARLKDEDGARVWTRIGKLGPSH